MLEFYQAYATYETLMDRTEELLRHVDQTLAHALPAQHAERSATRPCTLERIERVPLGQALAHGLALGLPPEALLRRACAAGIAEWMPYLRAT